MAIGSDNLIFLVALLNHVNRLKHLLAKDWPSFRDNLSDILIDLVAVENDKQVLDAVNRIIETGLKSGPVKMLFKSLLKQALEHSKKLEITTRSVRLSDPTSGENSRCTIAAFGL